MSFGFSVGDFIAALELVGTVVASLREAGGSKSQFKELTHELFALETALLRVKQLEFDDDDALEYAALRQVACQCQHTITLFWTTTTKYQKHLHSETERANIKTLWLKAQWSLFKSEEVVRFKADLAAHTQSIMLLLATFQTRRLKTYQDHNQATTTALRASVELAAQQCAAKLVQVSSSVGNNVLQGQQILQSCLRIFQSNLRIYQVVCSIHSMLHCLPPQIDRQQPVYMIDALGKMSPFHLEFVRSAAALQAVLKANFERVPSGSRKINNGEFVIYESATGRQIDLEKDWDTCLLPGQRIDMRMVFQRGGKDRRLCPACHTRCQKAKTKHSDVECSSCGLIFGRVEEVQEISDVPGTTEPTKVGVRHYALAFRDQPHARIETTGMIAPQTAFDESEDIQCYRRVRILQRRRRRIWEIENPVVDNSDEENTAHDGPSARNDDITGITEEQPTGFDFPGDVVDFVAFEQLLDMDEDDEREFTRLVVLDTLQQIAAIMDKARPLIYAQAPDLDHVPALCHHAKGNAATLGLTKVKDIGLSMQYVAANIECLTDYNPTASLDQQSQVTFLKDQMVQFEMALETASIALHKFYRVEYDGYK